jgi:hypothetical protein
VYLRSQKAASQVVLAVNVLLVVTRFIVVAVHVVRVTVRAGMNTKAAAGL